MAVTRGNRVIILNANDDTVIDNLYVQKVTFRETANSTAAAEVLIDENLDSFVKCPNMTAYQLIQFDFHECVPISKLKLSVTSGAVEVRVYIE